VLHWDDEYDAVIVGHGAAGAAAAIEAARAGARTVVLERASRGGGTTALSTGVIYFGGGTRVQKACGFEDSVDDMMRYVRLAAGAQADPEKVRRYCEDSVEHFDWFCELGVEFKDSYYDDKVTHPLTDDCLLYSGNEKVYPFARHASPVPRGHKVMREGEAGGTLMEVMIRATHEAGATVIDDCAVEALVVGDAERVVGVVARSDGRERLIKASKGVVLAAGGFIMNREMLARHAPALLQCNYPLGTPGDDGRGIRMGAAVGGAAVNMSEGLVLNAYYPPSSHLMGVMVNAQGQRFINEDAYLGRTSDAILYKADGVAYLVVDDEIYGQTQAMHKIAAVAEGFEALERELDMPEGSLTHTVAYYNEHARRGEDPLFHKSEENLRPLSTPPYAALDCSTRNSIFGAFTLGGLATRATGEVLTEDGVVVPGLYAAGRNSAGLILEGRCYASGLSIGGASYFGRLAGRQVAGASRWE
jgi:succinate dehydrogenase/fumarate reductase flavoprotein subunit